MKEEWLAIKLALQLTGKVQQDCYEAKDTRSYWLLKEAILCHYDISDETYRKRSVKKEEEVRWW